ncbi:MAG: ATP-binding cassette domain-containing protein [Candidatus Altiarchaeota archaeon]|nr:ATP-binding cassette domain-containing protein [Candidatus Altiarchaeota archaeon]
MEEIISIKNLSYGYPGGTVALNDVSLDILRGESIALLGPNGAGKSTLLLHLNGVLSGKGSIEVFGRNIREKKRSELIKEIGVVFQHPDDQLFMPTIFDDVAFGPINMGLDRGEVERRVSSALEKVGLSGYENRYPHQLSLGEKKKAALATILSMDPEIIVLDEPTANLDPKSRRDLVGVMRDLKERGKTVIISTHDVSLVPGLADRVYVLDRKIIAEGTPKEIFLNTELLKKANLEIPPITYLFEVLSCFGYNCSSLPLSMDEAVKYLTDSIETEGGHIHLHLHEHTHEDLRRLKEKYGHH